MDEIPEGEVSPYLVRDVLPGDELEVKGPLGGYFVWRPGGAEPVQLIAGGSGIVPLMAMARARRDAAAGVPFRLLYSVRGPKTRYIAMSCWDSTERGSGCHLGVHANRASGVGRTCRPTRRGDARRRGLAPDRLPAIYVCGPTGFVEHVADTLVGARPRRPQHQDRAIRRCVMRAENATWVVDGNAAAGILSEVFTGDVTRMLAECGGCGSVAPFAEAVVELDEPAAIVRCRGCTHTLVTVLREADVRVVIGTLRRPSWSSAQQERDGDQDRHASDRREEHRVA